MSKILITSALPYINGVKHLGNLVGSLLPADVHARFRRQVGDEVLFICGTDEHGTPAELGAIEAGEDVRHYCDAQHAIQADIYRRFGLSFDHFGRSSCRQNQCGRVLRCRAMRKSSCARAVIAFCANRCWLFASMPGSTPARGGRLSWRRWRRAG